MSKPLELYQIGGSPNNLRVRIALGFKGLAYDTWDLPMGTGQFPFDRSRLVELSGQPRTPVLKHGEVVIFDSGGILRYLEANFRDTPRLFREDWAVHGEIEEWEHWVRVTLAPPIRAMFGQALAPAVEINRAEVRSIEPSLISQLPPGLVNALNADELKDLVAYLMSRGDRDDAAFRK